MDKMQTDINNKAEAVSVNSSGTDFEQVQSDGLETKAETTSESGAQKSDVKTTSKDSVFRDLFGDRKYALQLYKAIHPEDTDVTEADIGSVTIKNIFTDQQYNDLGMTVRGKLLLMLEAQSNWTMNIIIRILLYLAHTWNEYIESTEQNRYGSKKLAVPRPELYMIYSGERKTRPEWIRLSDEFFEGNKEYLEVNVKVLYGDAKGDIISQYVKFTKVLLRRLNIDVDCAE